MAAWYLLRKPQIVGVQTHACVLLLVNSGDVGLCDVFTQHLIDA